MLSIALVLGALAVACGGSGASGPSPTPSPPPATPTPTGPDLTIFRGFTWPIAGACLPQSDLLMPNAPREYRSGIHEGVDLYGIDNCVPIDDKTEVVAAKDGRVIRADTNYTPLTAEQLAEANRRIAAGGANDFEVVDLFRGRQVWIDHGNGVITRYAHLGGVAEGLQAGQQVLAGQTIAYVGDSGTPESLSNPGQETHLHFELRVGDSYLGANLQTEEVRALYTNLFAPFPE